MISRERRGVALYLTIGRTIQEKITSGEWEEGFKLPSEPDLAADFQVSRFTVRQAINELVEKGYLIRRRGNGTFVSKPSFEGNFVKSFFPSDLGSLHKLISLQRIEATPFVRKRLDLPERCIVTELYRARYILDDESPAILEKTYFESDLIPDIEDMDMSGRLYEYIMTRRGIELVKAKSVIEAVLPQENESEILLCPMGHPLLMMTRICFTTGEKPVLLTKSLIRTDRCKLSMEDTM